MKIVEARGHRPVPAEAILFAKNISLSKENKTELQSWLLN